VRRKVEAINAWIKYAWMIEPKEPVTLQNQSRVRMPSREVAKQSGVPPAVLELPGRNIAPKPRYTSMIQKPMSPAAPMLLETPSRQDPPPPYSEADRLRAPVAAISGRDGVGSPSAVQQLMTRRHFECIFCTKCFTRTAKMWDCAERHLMRRATEAVPCPHPDCKDKETVLENEVQFKNHAKVVHNCSLRPKVTSRMTPPEYTRSTPKIGWNAPAHHGQNHGTPESPRHKSPAERVVSTGRTYPSRMVSTVENQEGEYFQVEDILESRLRRARKRKRRECLVKWR
jgi:hypothetical protein